MRAAGLTAVTSLLLTRTNLFCFLSLDKLSFFARRRIALEERRPRESEARKRLEHEWRRRLFGSTELMAVASLKAQGSTEGTACSCSSS